VRIRLSLRILPLEIDGDGVAVLHAAAFHRLVARPAVAQALHRVVHRLFRHGRVVTRQRQPCVVARLE